MSYFSDTCRFSYLVQFDIRVNFLKKNVIFFSDALTPPVNYYRQFMKTWSTTESSKDIIDITPNGLLIFGELDDYLTREILNLAQKNVKNLQVNIVKGANHFVQQDDPDTVNKHITEFLRSNLVTTNADINASS